MWARWRKMARPKPGQGPYLGCVLGHLPDTRGGVLADVRVRVPQTRQDLGEDLRLHHHLPNGHADTHRQTVRGRMGASAYARACMRGGGLRGGSDGALVAHLRQVNAVLRDLGQAGAHLALELAVVVLDERRQVRDGARVDHSLGQL